MEESRKPHFLKEIGKRLAGGSIPFLALIFIAYFPAAAADPQVLIDSPVPAIPFHQGEEFVSSTGGDSHPVAPNAPLAKMLTPDGLLDLPPGFSGNLDAGGWKLVSQRNEPPRFLQSIPGDEKWAPGSGPNGVNGTVNAMAVDGDGNVYVGGSFNMAGNLSVRGIAKWDGVGWYPLGYGLDGDVDALTWDSIHGWLYAGGYFKGICMNADCSARNPSRGVARWDPGGGGSWHPLAYGVDGVVWALAVDDTGNLYAGGLFPSICNNADCTWGLTVNHIAKWNPAGSGIYWDWSALSDAGGIGVTDGSVNALAWWNAGLWVGNVLVVGGSLTSAGGKPMNHLTMWSPSNHTWSSFWSGVDGQVNALAVDPTTATIIVGGDFFNICGSGDCSTKTPANRIAVAAGLSKWEGLNYGIYGLYNGTIKSLTLDNANRSLYVGGSLDGYCHDPSCSTRKPISNIARWDYTTLPGPGSWSELWTGTDGAVNAVAWNDKAYLLYAGGFFKLAGGVPTQGLATWNKSSWSSVGTGNGVSPEVYAVAADGNGRVYVGGNFRAVGSLFVNRIAVWNSQKSAWATLGHGVNDRVEALTLDSNGNLYVGGWFRFLCGNADCTTTGQRANYIAKWTPSGDSGNWSEVGLGFDSFVNALAVDHNKYLYAGGSFTGICGDAACLTPSSANYVAVWDGQVWSNLGLGLNQDVRALAVDQGNKLYAGGDFWNICGSADCATWGQRVNHIAEWTPAGGGNWSPVGNGLDSNVLALVVDRNNTLYAGGDFKYICATPGCVGDNQRVSGIAKWNGAWSSVGNGLKDGFVNALGLDEGNNLYAGGFFQSLCGDAGCYTAGATINHVARWDGGNWSALGSGVGPWPFGYIQALALSRGNLWVGGNFGTAGDKVSANFARYTYGTYTYLPLILR
jgi:hypothetical protein